MAVDEINKAGGFKVGDKTYKLELISLDTRGDPKEATIQLKRLLEQDKARFVFGPFLSNVFVTVLPYAKQFNGKFLLMGGATRMHDFVGTPEHDFVIRTWNWDAGPNGFGERMVDYLIKTAGPKKIAMLFQNDQGGKVLGEIYEPLFKAKGIETVTEYFEPGTKDFTPVLAKLAAFKADYLFPGYTDAPLYDIVRQATEGNFIRKFFLVRGSLGPGMKNKDGIEDYIVYVPKYFEEAEKTSPKVKQFVEAYKAFYKRDFPYDQAPLCSSSCYDHVYMLVAAMQKAGTVEDVGQDPRGAALFHLQRRVDDQVRPARRADLRLRHRPPEEGRRHPDHARRALIGAAHADARSISWVPSRLTGAPGERRSRRLRPAYQYDQRPRASGRS